ncbi:unnamed protein product [Phytophthora fragariaefolia]|uniref:Unnamed protein product n=1 Tax=Phytophthora fragariaefolia TaxID=1490495 RepID=A0A9W7CSW9_9STRA|nr:unnamed protein product [Phytophthora fragariaefolia]
MTVLIDSGAPFNFATKASVARNSALYASALEASHGNTDFDDLASVEPFIVLDMDDQYDLILDMPWLAKHEPWIDWRSRTIGGNHKPLADRALVGHAVSASRDGFVYELRLPQGEQHIVGTSKVVTTPSESSPRALELGENEKQFSQTPSPTPVRIQGPAGSNRGGSVQDPPQQVFLVLDVLMGKPKVGVTLEPLPSVAELLELEELFYLDVLKSLKAGELEEVVLVRAEQFLGELNSSSVMYPEVLEDEQTSQRKMRYGSDILQDPSDPYYGLIKEFSDVVNDDPPSVLLPD